MDLITILPYIGIVLGFIGLFVVLTMKSALKSMKGMSKAPTYSNNIDKAEIEQGIYVEHGMARNIKTTILKAQSKRSKSFFESLV